MEARVLELAPVYVQSSGEQLGSATLRKFQKELADIREGAVVLSAPTGSGKTVTLLTDPEGVALGLYPNNELICSQVAGLDSFIQKYLGMRRVEGSLLELCRDAEADKADNVPMNVYEAEQPVDILGRGVKRIYIAGMGGRVLRSIGEKGKLDTLVELSEHLGRAAGKEYVVALATPDTFFLLSLYLYQDFESLGRLLSLLMSSSGEFNVDEIDKAMMQCGFTRDKLAKITRVFLPFLRSTLFIDEYHLYDYYELASFKALAYVLRHVHRWEGRVVFSSATPRAELAEDVAENLGLNLEQVDAISHVKEEGAEHELVRGPLKLVIYSVETGARSKIAKLYWSSGLAYKLIGSDELAGFLGSEEFASGKARGMAVLEKVSHAELFAEELYRKHGVKPLCLYSMPRSDLCSPSSGFIVGTGAKIGQGVEYEGIIFGVVARVSAPDLLQSLGRFGRRYAGESTVLVPLDANLVAKPGEDSLLVKEGRITYGELARWAEEKAAPWLKRVPEDYVRLLEALGEAREKALKALSMLLHYRLSQAYSEKIEATVREAVKELKSLSTMSRPERLYHLLMFRDSGPTVTYGRWISGNFECGESDLGTLVRNYELRAPEEREACPGGKKPALVIDRVREEFREVDIAVKCGKPLKFKRKVLDKYESPQVVLIDWSTLRDSFGCRCVHESGAGRLEVLESQLDGQLFLLLRIKSRDFADYVYRRGRGLKIKLDGTATALVYV